jgi:hypothetical protein
MNTDLDLLAADAHGPVDLFDGSHVTGGFKNKIHAPISQFLNLGYGVLFAVVDEMGGAELPGNGFFAAFKVYGDDGVGAPELGPAHHVEADAPPCPTRPRSHPV